MRVDARHFARILEPPPLDASPSPRQPTLGMRLRRWPNDTSEIEKFEVNCIHGARKTLFREPLPLPSAQVSRFCQRNNSARNSWASRHAGSRFTPTCVRIYPILHAVRSLCSNMSYGTTRNDTVSFSFCGISEKVGLVVPIVVSTHVVSSCCSKVA